MHRERQQDPDHESDEQVYDPGAVVSRQVGDLQGGGVEPVPVAQAHEDQVSHRCSDQARQQHRDRCGTQADRRFEQQHSRDQRSVEQGRDRGERARAPHDLGLLRTQPGEQRHRDADCGAERDQRCLRPQHGAEGQRAEGRQRDARDVSERGGAATDSISGEWPPPPGRRVTAARTNTAPSVGSPRTRNQGGEEYPRASGRSVQSRSSPRCTAARKSAATSAAGMPIAAPRSTSLRYAVPDRPGVGGSPCVLRSPPRGVATRDQKGTP